MHTIHTTPGFIIDSRPYGEADKLITIFTRDFGLVTATAQGIRLEKSKLRYFCQDYSFGTFSLVRGKEFWRLTSAADLNVSGEGSVEGVRVLMGRIALLLRRLLHGEEANPDLFDVLEKTRAFLAANPALTEDQAKTLESIAVLSILNSLGYVGSDSALAPFLDHEPFTVERIGEAAAKRAAINSHINRALKESHL